MRSVVLPAAVLACLMHGAWLLFLVSGVHADGYGTVVHQLNLHVGSKLARAYLAAYFAAQLVAELVV